MMSKKSPQLRFEGFTDDWEQRKLGELSQKISVGIATSSSKYFSSQDHGVPFIKNQDIKENRINTKNLEYISKEFDNKNKNKRVKQGDIITARTGYPGLSAVVPKELEGAQTFTTLITRPISEMILSEYISIFINSPYGMKQISGMEAGGAQKNVNAGIVQNLLIPLPSLDEQKKISNFILKLDDTIALHQRKLDLLKEQKKGYLQKMFPKNGAKVPELRFAGFADDWEERKLKDVLDISKTKNKAQQYGKVDVLSVSREVGTVNQIKHQGRSFAGSDLSNYKVVQGGELIYTKSPLKGAPYGIFQVATIKGIISPLYAVYTSTDKAYTPFVATALKNDNIATHYLTPLVTKGAKNTINVTDEGALEGKLQFPSILEQKQIFIFFKQLDDTIALHQRKLEKLQELKKGYLQKMFC